MSIQMRIEITTSPTAGILKGLAVGNHELLILDHQVAFISRSQGGGPKKEAISLNFTSDTPQLVSDGDTIDGVEIKQLRVRVR